MIQMIITQNGFLTHNISGTHLCGEKKITSFLNGIRNQQGLSRFFVSFLRPAFTATLSHINGLFISLIPLPYMVFLLHELVLGEASLRAPELGKCRRSVPQNVVSQGSACQCRSPHGPAHHRGLFFSRFLKKQQRAKLNGSLRALPILTITASPSGNVITHHISRTAHILKGCVFWCATDHFQMQQTEFSCAKVARNGASPH